MENEVLQLKYSVLDPLEFLQPWARYLTQTLIFM